MSQPYPVGPLEIHEYGARRKLSVRIYDEDGALADPTTLTFTMRDPDNVRTTYVSGTDAQIVRESVGVFHVYWDCVKTGRHRWRFAATGSIGAAAEAGFIVEHSDVLA